VSWRGSPGGSWFGGRIAARIALAALLVAAVTVGLLAVGVLGLAGRAFEELMVQHGATAAEAHAMFDATVTMVFLATAAVAVIVALGLALVLGRRIAAPVERIGRAARRIAEGEYLTRVPREGPEEIASLADSFNQMAESLEAQERSRREFIANAAHELRTPLTNLQGYLEALRDGVVPPDPATFDSLSEEVDRLVRLSRAIDALAEGDVGQARPAAVELDVAVAIRAAVEMVQPSLERAGLALRLEVPQTLAGRANPDHLAQVLGNLLQNAVRYTPPGGTITVTARARPGDILVSVANTGDGIPAADLPHIFERFYRVEKSRDRGRGGAGIGLAIVKQLVEAEGGRVGAESVGGLTRVWFSLPA